MDSADHDMPAFRPIPQAHRPRIHGTSPLERLNTEIKCHAGVPGIFPNDAAIVRLVGALMLRRNGEWSANRPHRQLEGPRASSDDPQTRLVAVPATPEESFVKARRRRGLLGEYATEINA